LAGYVGERQLAELIDDRIELGTGSKIRVLIARMPGRIEVRLSFAPAL